MNRADHPVTQPLVGRQRRLVIALWTGLIVAAGTATFAVLLPGRGGELAGQAFLASVIAIPLLRVLWLTSRWFMRRDLRFGAAGLSLLAVAVAAAVIAIV